MNLIFKNHLLSIDPPSVHLSGVKSFVIPTTFLYKMLPLERPHVIRPRMYRDWPLSPGGRG